MKKIFVLFLTALLVVACFSGCKNESTLFGDKDQIYYVSYSKTDDGFNRIFATVYVHNFGNLDDLPVGKYDVTEIEIRDSKLYSIKPTEIIVEVDRGFNKTKFYDTKELKDLNENPPKELVEILEDIMSK